MRIPEFQSGQPGSNPPDHAVPAGSRRAFGEVRGAHANYGGKENSILPAGEAVRAADTVDFSALSLAVLEDRNPIYPVARAATVYSLDRYVVNPEKLAQALLRASLIGQKDGK